MTTRKRLSKTRSRRRRKRLLTRKMRRKSAMAISTENLSSIGNTVHSERQR